MIDDDNGLISRRGAIEKVAVVGLMGAFGAQTVAAGEEEDEPESIIVDAEETNEWEKSAANLWADYTHNVEFEADVVEEEYEIKGRSTDWDTGTNPGNVGYHMNIEDSLETYSDHFVSTMGARFTHPEGHVDLYVEITGYPDGTSDTDTWYDENL